MTQKSRLKRRLQLRRFLLEPLGQVLVAPVLAREPRAAQLGVVHVALDLADGAREDASAPSASTIEFHESFQHWLSSPVLVLRR